jgi:ATP-dependent Clp protease adaptor protein ClpS
MTSDEFPINNPRLSGEDVSATVTVSAKPRTARPRVGKLPPWKVLLHNDDINDMGFVIEAIVELTTLAPQLALIRTIEAHKTGVSMLLCTHREYAELLQEQFASKGLVVTIEPDDS